MNGSNGSSAPAFHNSNHPNGHHNLQNILSNGDSRQSGYATSAAGLSRGPTETELEFHLRETEQLLEISLLKKKLRETELAMSNIIAKMGSVPKGQVSADASELNIFAKRYARTFVCLCVSVFFFFFLNSPPVAWHCTTI